MHRFITLSMLLIAGIYTLACGGMRWHANPNWSNPMEDTFAILLYIFFFPIRLFIVYPYLAFLPAFLFGLFAYIDLKRRGKNKLRWGLLWPSIIWSIYGIYEISMYYWSKTVDIPIRVDLVLVIPVVYFITFMGIRALLNMRKSWSEAKKT